MPEDMPDRMPEDMPDRTPDRMPEDMPDKMPEDMPNKMPGRTQGEFASTKTYKCHGGDHSKILEVKFCFFFLRGGCFFSIFRGDCSVESSCWMVKIESHLGYEDVPWDGYHRPEAPEALTTWYPMVSICFHIPKSCLLYYVEKCRLFTNHPLIGGVPKNGYTKPLVFQLIL